MIDQPAPFLSADEMAARRTTTVAVGSVGRLALATRPMTASEAAAAFLHAAVLAEFERDAR